MRAASLDHLLGAHEQPGRHGKAERLRGLEIDHQLDLGGLLHRQVRRLLALENAARIDTGLAVCIRETAPIAYQTAASDKLTKLEDRGNCVTNRQFALRLASAVEELICARDHDDWRGRLVRCC